MKRLHQQILLALAGLTLLIGLVQPTLTLPRSVHRYRVIVDITQSMNTEDYHHLDYPSNRLGFVKATLHRMIRTLPCGSEISVGLFTTQNIQFLFDPLEVCQHSGVLNETLDHIDWRMAWAADSHVEMGIYHALNEMARDEDDARLIFFTDGQETPPQSVKPQYQPEGYHPSGMIVGVGGLAPSTVPRFDRDNRRIGNWENADIDKPPISTNVYSLTVETRSLPETGPYLSSLDETHLKEIAAYTQLEYFRLEEPDALINQVLKPRWAIDRPTRTDIRPGLALMALALVLIQFLGVKQSPHSSNIG